LKDFKVDQVRRTDQFTLAKEPAFQLGCVLKKERQDGRGIDDNQRLSRSARNAATTSTPGTGGNEANLARTSSTVGF